MFIAYRLLKALVPGLGATAVTKMKKPERQTAKPYIRIA